ncbi:hypothetical protein FQA45_14840 [Glutamicibacter halophytocola]|uniref:ApeA N-terminal domain-containing protein n=1 Tax=Glutamicibacter halophytocola TaxID=1933880 RepID=A0ABX5YCV4_9MICC|nr:hypothetical protein [Glutamicibacter halophytocola]QDY67479.1 hypothetical protein FQA45_14840 [Glutamicibacter halophytocola]
MASKKLTTGDSLTGLLVDGIAGTPYVSALLTYDALAGVSLEVPYISEGVEQFSSVSQWARDMKPPSNLLFLSDRQSITLYGCRVTSTRETLFGNNISTVKITPREVVLKDRDGDHSDDLKVVELRSQLDGLAEWTRFGVIQSEVETGPDGLTKKLTVEVESKDPVTWKVGEVTFSLQSTWGSVKNDLGSEIHEGVNLHTTFDEPRSCSEHLVEQRKFISLLALIYGTAVSFRHHDVRDSRFRALKNAEGEFYTPFYELLSGETISDFEREVKPKQFERPLSKFSQLGKDGLARWFDSYDEWERVIQPVAGTLQRPLSYMEDHVVNACIGLEAAGQIIEHVVGEESTYRGKNPILATYIYRCLATVELKHDGIAISRIAMARGIAKIYNDTKHYDRFDYPPGEHSYVIGKLALLTARLLSLRLFGVESVTNSNREVTESLRQVREYMEMLGLLIDDKGKFADSADVSISGASTEQF